MTTERIHSTTRARRVALACAFVLAAVATATTHARAATNWLVSFTIDDTTAVQGDGKGEYKDYRLTPSGGTDETDANFCVEAAPNTSATLFVRLNRNLDGNPGYLRCDQYSSGTPRQFTLVVNADSACTELWSNSYTSSAVAPCTITGGPNPRIRANELWARKPTGPTAFLTTNPNSSSAISYEVRLESASTVSPVAGAPDSKIASYSGTARLWKFGDGKTRAVADPFPLPFHMTFTRFAQP